MKAEETGVLWYCCHDPNYLNFKVFDFRDELARSIQTPYQTTYPFAAAQLGDYVYFTGGGLPPTPEGPENYFAVTMSVHLETASTASSCKRANMHVARASHTLAVLNPKRFYAVGGCNGTGLLGQCEEHAIEKGTWTDRARLNEAKKHASVAVFNNRYLYVFGGQLAMAETAGTAGTASSTIERLDTINEGAKLWTCIVLTEGKGLWLPCFFVGCRQIDPETILIWGGLADQKMSDSILAFKPETKALISQGKMDCPDLFYSTPTYKKGDQLLVIGATDSKLHMYNLGGKSWKSIMRSSWDSLGFDGFKSDTY